MVRFEAAGFAALLMEDEPAIAGVVEISRRTRLTGPAVDPGDGSGLQSSHGESTAVEFVVEEYGHAVEEERSYGGGILDAGRALGFVAALVVERPGSW